MDVDLVPPSDDTAFLTIMERLLAKIFAPIVNLLLNHAYTEKIVQDTFPRARRGIAISRARNRYCRLFLRRRRAVYFYRLHRCLLHRRLRLTLFAS